MIRMFVAALGFGLLTWFGAALPAQSVRIGEHGATLSLPAGWKKQIHDADLGDNQFLAKRKKGWLSPAQEAYVVIFEFEGLVETDEDVAASMAGMSALELEGPARIERGEHYLRATQKADTEISGLKVLYRMELLSRDGLSFFVLSWSLRSHRKYLDEQIDSFLDGFTFPPADSKWARSLQPEEHEVWVGDRRISFETRPFVLREQPLETDQVLCFADPEYRHAAYAFESDFSSADEALEAAFEACDEGEGTMKEVERRDFRVSDLDGRMMVATSPGLTLHLVALPLGRGRYLDLRYVAAGSPDDTREDRDLFLKSLKSEPAETSVAIPEPQPTVHRPTLAPWFATLLEGGRKLSETHLAYLNSIQAIGEGRWLARDGERAIIVTRGQTPETAAKLDSWQLQDVAPQGGSWLVTSRDEVVQRASSGTFRETLPYSARLIAPLDDDFLILRSDDTEELPGLTSGTQMGTDLLIRRSAEGEETVLARLPNLHTTRLVVDGDKALLVTNDRPTAATEAYVAGTRCLEIDVGSGARSDLGAWDSIDNATACDEGWLITGQPENGSQGVHLCDSLGSIRTLLRGPRTIGVGLSRERVILATDLLSTESQQPYELIEVERAALPAADTQNANPSIAELERVADAVIDLGDGSTAPRSESEIRGLLQAADRAAEERGLRPLPRSGRDVDALMADAQRLSGQLSLAARALLGLLIVRCNLEAGAQWVDADDATEAGRSGWAVWLVGPQRVDATAFTLASTPGGLLSSCLDDSEGSWNPGTSLIDQARGRRILLGLDVESLSTVVTLVSPRDVETVLARAKPDAIQRLLETQSTNRYFRERVYEHLAVHGWTEALETIARPWAERPEPDVLDVRAALAARNANATSPAQIEQLAEDALAAVTAHPDQADLFLTLGLVFERARPDDRNLARSCFQRALRLQSWGSTAAAAQEGLQRLAD